MMATWIKAGNQVIHNIFQQWPVFPFPYIDQCVAQHHRINTGCHKLIPFFSDLKKNPASINMVSAGDNI